MILSRRKLFTGLAALIAAPTIVRVASIMPVRSVPDFSTITNEYWQARASVDGWTYERIDPSADLMQVIMGEFAPSPDMIHCSSSFLTAFNAELGAT